MSKRDEVIEKAQDIINGARQDVYGPPEENLARIARGWEVILGLETIERYQVALCMDWLKTARLIESPTDEDTYVDKIGYSALAAEQALPTLRDTYSTTFTIEPEAASSVLDPLFGDDDCECDCEDYDYNDEEESALDIANFISILRKICGGAEV